MALLADSLVFAAGSGVAAYDAIARRLTSAGWKVATPIAVFGDPYTSRASLEWYLPGQPRLAFARSARQGCRRILVVRPNGQIRVLGHRHGAVQPPRHSFFLVGMTHPPACTRVLRVSSGPVAVAVGASGG